MRVVLLCLVVSFALEPLMAQTSPGTPPEKRLALVIGNSHYNTTALTTALNDASDMAATLKELGFEVMLYTDLDRRNFRKAVDEFSAKLKEYQTGLFFYSGHGLSLADQNYLVPIDASPQTAGDVEFDCFPASQVMTKMETAKVTTNIIILDVDRNGFSNTGSSRGSNFLGSETLAGFLTAYATSPRSSIVESTGRNSIYIAALLANIKTPGLAIEEVLSRTRRQVIQQTNNKQLPWETSSLTQDFYFSPK